MLMEEIMLRDQISLESPVLKNLKHLLYYGPTQSLQQAAVCRDPCRRGWYMWHFPIMEI